MAESPRRVVKGEGGGLEAIKRENIGGWTVSLIKGHGARLMGAVKTSSFTVMIFAEELLHLPTLCEPSNKRNGGVGGRFGGRGARNSLKDPKLLLPARQLSLSLVKVPQNPNVSSSALASSCPCSVFKARWIVLVLM